MEAINWEGSKSISESSGLNIVISPLIYVGLEVRQTAKATSLPI